MRALWSGSIAFGLVNIPVRLYSASVERALNFDMLHKKDLSPIRFARICKADGQEIPYKDIVKGYEISKGQYVVVTEEDFKAASMTKSNSIDIEEFVDESEIDPMFFDKPYYLEPDKGAGRAYVLLREGLKKSGKVGVAKFVLRNREHVALVKNHENVLLLYQLRFSDEIRPAKELEIPAEKPIAKEVDMAVSLIDQMTAKFQPGKFKDTYAEDLISVIEKRAHGKLPKAMKASETRPTKVVDLFETLKASLQEGSKAKKPPRQRKTA